MTRYLNLKANILDIQKEHGTEVAAIVLRLRGCPLWYALNKLVYFKEKGTVLKMPANSQLSN